MQTQNKEAQVERRAGMNDFMALIEKSMDGISRQLNEKFDKKFDEFDKRLHSIEGESMSSRESVNANSRHLIAMTDIVRPLVEQITQYMQVNTEQTIVAADAAKAAEKQAKEANENSLKALEMAKKSMALSRETKKETEGVIGIYDAAVNIVETGKKIVQKGGDVISGGFKKTSRFSKLLAPIVLVVTLAASLIHGDIHWNDIVKAAKKIFIE